MAPIVGELIVAVILLAFLALRAFARLEMPALGLLLALHLNLRLVVAVTVHVRVAVPHVNISVSLGA